MANWLDRGRLKRALPKGWAKDPRVVARIVLGVLLLANIVAALIVFKPWAASLEQLEQQAAGMRQNIVQAETEIERLRSLVAKVETARADGDRFMDGYLLGRRTVASTLLQELEQMARKAGVKPKEASYNVEPVEGSDSLSKATITATYEGTYSDLIHYLNLLDRSPRFLIIESLGAAPQQSGLTLGVTLRLNAFVREGGSAPEVAVEFDDPAVDHHPGPADESPAPAAASAAAPEAPAAVSEIPPARPPTPAGIPRRIPRPGRTAQ